MKKINAVNMIYIHPYYNAINTYFHFGTETYQVYVKTASHTPFILKKT